MKKLVVMFEQLFKIFEENNKNIYHVGGSVRDRLLGKIPNDYDFTTDALPDEIEKILINNKISNWAIGKKFGTIVAKINKINIEITTHRKDTTSGRHPNVIFTNDLVSDLRRRDFTINSMAVGIDGKLIDPFNGFKHLKYKIIKTTGEPKERFSEDPLRMLRAIRFSSQLDFNIVSNTFNIIKRNSQFIMNVSKERWLEELNKLLLGDYSYKGLELFKKSRLLNYILPELYLLTISNENNSKDLWHHTLTAVSRSTKNISVKWAALLHDIAKPQTMVETKNQIRFFQHEIIGSEIADGILRRLKTSSNFRKEIVNLILLHHRIINVVDNNKVSKSGLKRVIKDCKFCDIYNLVDLFYADCSSKKKDSLLRQEEHTELLKQSIQELKEDELKPKLPRGIGNEIMKNFNLESGKEVGDIKDKLYELLLDDKININMSFDEMFKKL